MRIMENEVLLMLRRPKADVFGDGGAIDPVKFAKCFRVGEYAETVRRVRESGDIRALAADSGFRKAYRKFFGMGAAKITPSQLDAYFGELPGLKERFDRNPAQFRGERVGIYSDLLGRLREMRGDVEKSFASKLIAVVDTTAPIIDSRVEKYLRRAFRSDMRGIGSARWADGPERRIEVAAGTYGLLEREYADVSGSEECIEWFRGSLPEEYRGEITDVKAIDFLIWGILGR